MKAISLNDTFIQELWYRINSIRAAYLVDRAWSGISPECAPFNKGELREMIENAFLASHETEERLPARTSLMLCALADIDGAYRFDYPLRLCPASIVKLGAALDSAVSDICIRADSSDSLNIWGFKTRSSNHVTNNLRVLILGPDKILIICHGRSIAAITGSTGKFIDQEIIVDTLLARVCHEEATERDTRDCFHKLKELLLISQAMQAHGQGGTLLVIPADSEWEKSIKQPALYRGQSSSSVDTEAMFCMPSESDSGFLSEFMHMLSSSRNTLEELPSRLELSEQCRQTGRLTAADGALVMTIDRDLLCFGAKIQPVVPLAGTTRIRVTSPVEGGGEHAVMLADFGGTRHQSALQFVHDQPGALAVVSSQDGRLTLMVNNAADSELLAIRDAELALMHEGILGAFWNFYRFMNSRKKLASTECTAEIVASALLAFWSPIVM